MSSKTALATKESCLKKKRTKKKEETVGLYMINQCSDKAKDCKIAKITGGYFFFSCNGLHHIPSTRRKKMCGWGVKEHIQSEVCLNAAF